MQVRGLAQLLQHLQHALEALLLALLGGDHHVGLHLGQRICQLTTGCLSKRMRLLQDCRLSGTQQGLLSCPQVPSRELGFEQSASRIWLGCQGLCYLLARPFPVLHAGEWGRHLEVLLHRCHLGHASHKFGVVAEHMLGEALRDGLHITLRLNCVHTEQDRTGCAGHVRNKASEYKEPWSMHGSMVKAWALRLPSSGSDHEV